MQELEFLSTFQIVLGVLARFWPVWVGLAIVLGASIVMKRRLGLYGQLFDNGVGGAGVVISLFCLFTAIFPAPIAPFDPLAQIPVMKDQLPYAIEPVRDQPYLPGPD